MSDPAVSVVLPFRDASTTLGDALQSIARQSRGDFECVMVDHLSSDASRRIATEMSARDPRFRLIRSAGTLIDALNAGVDAGRAPLIARMDADDLAHPTRLALQIAAFADAPSLALVSCLVRCTPDAELPAGMRRYQRWINSVRTDQDIRETLFVESAIPHPTAMFRRPIFEKVGRYRDTGGPEDYDLWLRMVLGGHRARKVERTLLDWRDTPDRLSRTDARYAKQQFFETKVRHFPSAVAPGTPLQIWGTGPNARRWSRRLRQHGYPIRRFVDIVRKNVGRSVHGTLVESPRAVRRADGLILAAVGLTGARHDIEQHLRQRGFRRGRDYLAVA